MDRPAAITPKQEVQNLLLAFELFEAGVAIMRQNLKRAYPEEAEEDRERRLSAWLAQERS
jgi:hypothetical protein